jgi:multidrug efflux pump subunit AcrA (membrane-fusion protein)
MSIRIGSLPLKQAGSLIAPPEAEIFIFSSGDRNGGIYSESDTEIDDIAEIANIYGGSSASMAVMPSSPAENDPSGWFNGLVPDAASGSPDRSAAMSNWSPALQTTLDRPPATLPNHLAVGGVMFCAVFAAWATMGQIDEVGHAQGRLVPQGETYKVNPVVAGKVAKVYVQENQSVKAGQVVAQLDDELARNRVEWSRQELVGYEQELLQVGTLIQKARLEAETRRAIANAEISAQKAQLMQAQANIASQKVAITQAINKTATDEALLSQLQTDSASHWERLSRFEYLVNEGALSREGLFQAQQQFTQLQRNITQQEGDIQQALAEAQRLRGDLQQGVAGLKRLQAELVRKHAEATNAQLQAQQSIQQLLVQKTQLQAKIQQSQKQFAQVQTELKQLTLRAPADGVVYTLNVRKEGEVVQLGQTIAEIAPQGAPLVLTAVLPTREAGFVKVGEPVQIKFDAYPYQDFGIVSGKVHSISPDSKLDERLGAVYRLEVVLDHNSLGQNGQEIPLKAGQTAQADIVIRQKRIAEMILDPIRKLKTGGLNL